MNNITLMKKVNELNLQKLTSREDSLKVITQIAIIRKAFNVRDVESDTPAKEYERELVMTDNQIKKQFNDLNQSYQDFTRLEYIQESRDYKARMTYFIEAVEFFKPELSAELKTLLSA